MLLEGVVATERQDAASEVGLGCLEIRVFVQTLETAINFIQTLFLLVLCQVKDKLTQECLLYLHVYVLVKE